MDIHILDFASSIKFVPDKPTYGIRIFNVTGKQEFDPGLIYSENWVRVIRCHFHDSNPEQAKRLCLGDHYIKMPKARGIIRDFAKYKERCEALMVSCMAGMNRAPATAIALNDVFNLGQDSKALRKDYPDLNEYIYETLVKAGKLEGIV